MNTKFTTASGEKVQFNIKEGQKFLNTTLNKIWGKKLLDKKIGNYKIRTLITGIKEEEEQGGYGIPESFIANYWDDPDWKTNKINIESTLEIKKKGEKTWWIEQAEKYLNEKQQIKNIIEILKTWIDKPIRKLQAIKKLKKPLRDRLTQLVGQGLTDWENIRQQIKNIIQQHQEDY